MRTSETRCGPGEQLRPACPQWTEGAGERLGSRARRPGSPPRPRSCGVRLCGSDRDRAVELGPYRRTRAHDVELRHARRGVRQPRGRLAAPSRVAPGAFVEYGAAVEPHHGSYPYESEPRWYRGEQQPVAPVGHARVEQADVRGYPPRDRRSVPRQTTGTNPAVSGPPGQWFGEPSARPSGPPTVPAERRVRRPFSGAVIAAAAIVAAIPVTRLLLESVFGES